MIPSDAGKKSTKDTTMTDLKKTAKDKAPAKGSKLQLNKETLRDLNLAKSASGPRAGRAPGHTHEDTCTMNRTQCDAARCD